MRKCSKERPVTSRVCFAVVIFTIVASDGSGSYTEGLPDLDELLGSSVDPDISDNEEEVGDRRMLTPLRFLVGYPR